jgi:NAD-dependent dihydropyrimidine dehydrogenase PreA subunit
MEDVFMGGTFKKYSHAFIVFFVFESVAVTLWLSLGKIFYLFNFSYIGFFVSLGIVFRIKQYKNTRMVVQFFVGLYLFVYLGIICRENMQIEGFFYYTALGIFQAASIHYLIAKIVGPFIFGRGWCGYACWTAMLLDLLPYKTPKNTRIKRLGLLRAGIFIVSLAYFLYVFNFHKENIKDIMFYGFIIGNIIYYSVGILFAVLFKDNRAFCKYFCPITIFLKPASYFSLLRIKCNKDKCISCNKCKNICPMDVDTLNNKRNRKNGTECILCLKCIQECPKQAIYS